MGTLLALDFTESWRRTYLVSSSEIRYDDKLCVPCIFEEAKGVVPMSQWMKAGDPIRVVPYDEIWPQRFQQLAQSLRQALGAVALRIDHIGSTSIPQLWAKPIIDLQISVADFEPLDAFRVPLEQCGYHFRAENPERTKRYFREAPGEPRVHIHVRRAGSFGEQFALLFRDYLRTHAEVAARYGQLKTDLAQRYGRVEEIHRYTDAKDPFIWGVMFEANKWAQQTGWQPGSTDA